MEAPQRREESLKRVVLRLTLGLGGRDPSLLLPEPMSERDEDTEEKRKVQSHRTKKRREKRELRFKMWMVALCSYLMLLMTMES